MMTSCCPRNPRACERPGHVTDDFDGYVLVATPDMPGASCPTMAWARAWARRHGVPTVLAVGAHGDSGERNAAVFASYDNDKDNDK